MSKSREPELHRIAGEVALKSPAPDAQKAQEHFEHALGVAREHQMKSVELRAATSLARLWRDQGKVQKRANCWVRFTAGFTEGFDTRDLKEAKSLLEELGA